MKQRKKQISDLNLREKQLKKDPTNSLLSVILNKEKKRFTVEDTIPYIRMLPEGICQLDEKNYSKTISFQDINYQLALEEDRDLIFNQFANFLNSFDPSVHI
ncbi:TPA: conjugal transfer protein TraE, partial [Streptococcus pyogenes]|nr:conjugal transfer protein TraE [Streptococcus pyogenes]